MWTRSLYVILALGLLVPGPVEAQRRRDWRIVVERQHNDFTFEPHVGFFRDAYDIGADDDRTTWLAGMRLGYRLASRARLLGTLAFARSDDIASRSDAASYNVYDNTWILTTIGAEYDVVPGRTSVALGLQGGAGWRKTTFEEAVGTDPDPVIVSDDGYSAIDVVVPSVTFRHWFARRAALTIGLQDYIFDVLEGPVDHSPAGSVGVTLR